MKQILFVAFLVNIFSVVSFANSGNTSGISPEQKQQARQWMSSQPVRFLENKGQMMDTKYDPVPFVLFKTSVPGMDMYITQKGLTCVFLKTEDEGKAEEAEKEENAGREDKEEHLTTEMAWLNIDLKGANIKAENIIKEGESREHFNFFYGHCPEGIYGVKEYERITIKEVYPGIDWVFYNADKQGMKYDFVVHPGADPNNIKLIYESAKPLTLNKQGGIEITTPLGTFSEQAPYSYINGNNSNEIPSHYTSKAIDDHNVEISFALPTLQLPISTALIIDPAIMWGTFYGGNDYDGPSAVDTDNNGNVFIAGYSESTNFPVQTSGNYYQPTQGGTLNTIILKFDNVGLRLWATYYGGSTNDQANAITTDAAGNIFITGITNSTNFPTQNLAGSYYQGALSGTSDAYVLKFSNVGARLWATYYGGNAYDRGLGITTDPTGNVFVTGSTDSPVFPTQNLAGAYFQGAYGGGAATYGDVFILKFTNAGARLWATYYGGSGNDRGYSIATDATGNVFVTGSTDSPNFPVLTAGTYYQGTYSGGSGAPVTNGDIFILKFTNACVRLWATYYGGSGDEKGISIIADATGNVFVTGYVSSTNFPLLNAATYYQGALGGGTFDSYILKFNNAGTRLWATYYGGNGSEGNSTFDDIEIDGCGNIYISFNTTSSNISVLGSCDGGYIDASYGSGPMPSPTDIVLVKFTNAGTRLWATYLGGDGSDFREALAVDANNNLFVCGEWNGVTNNGTYPLTQPSGWAYYDATYNGGGDDGFISKFSPVQLTASTSVIQPGCSNPCGGSAIVIPSPAACSYTYLWSNGQTTQTATGLCAGNYSVTVTNSQLCKTTTANAAINSSGALALTSSQTNAVCATLGSATVSVTTGTSPYTYSWSNGQFTQVATGLPAGTYTATVTDATGCSSTQTVTITQSGAISVSVSTTTSSCANANGTATATPSGGTSAYTYLWNNGQITQTATGLAAGTYSVTITDASGCTQTATANVSNTGSPQANISSSTNALCNGGNSGSATVNVTVGSAPYTYSWNPSGQGGATATGLSAGNYAVTVTDALGCIVIVPVTITEPTAITGSISSTNTNCGASVGTANVIPGGGTGSYTYLWNDGQITQTATGLAAGSYTATITDANGCSATQVVTVNSDNILNLTLASTPTGCTVNNGTATASPSSGSTPYTYNWSDGQVTQTSTGLGAGIYTVTITDANGCTGSDTVSVTTNNTMITSSSSTQAGCTVNNGTATVNPSNGITPYSYLWDNGQTTPTATGLGAGTYTATVTDANGCTKTEIVAVTINNTLVVNISFTQTACIIDNGTATASPSSGVVPYTYLWNNGQTTSTATGLGLGNYTVIVTDASGCTQAQTALVTTLPGPVVSPSAFPSTITEGDSTTLSTTGAGTYLWSPAAEVSCITCVNPVVSPIVTSIYCVKVTDINGCSDSACVTVFVSLDCENAGELFVPNAFSPNNDGENDVIQLYYGNIDCIKELKFIIYDRWGTKVFETEDPKRQWDGTYKENGNPEGTAVFAYYTQVILLSGEEIVKKGNITLLR